jgi:hypothetical protein
MYVGWTSNLVGIGTFDLALDKKHPQRLGLAAADIVSPTGPEVSIILYRKLDSLACLREPWGEPYLGIHVLRRGVYKLHSTQAGEPGEVDVALVKCVVARHKSWQHATARQAETRGQKI